MPRVLFVIALRPEIIFVTPAAPRNGKRPRENVKRSSVGAPHVRYFSSTEANFFAFIAQFCRGSRDVIAVGARRRMKFADFRRGRLETFPRRDFSEAR